MAQRLDAYVYYIDIVYRNDHYYYTTCLIYNMPHKADTTVICQCGAMVCKYYKTIAPHEPLTTNALNLLPVWCYCLCSGL